MTTKDWMEIRSVFEKVIGKTDDIGGSAKSGSVAAKLNTLLKYRPVFSSEYRWVALSPKIGVDSIRCIDCDEANLYVGVSQAGHYVIQKYDGSTLELVGESEILANFPYRVCVDEINVYVLLFNSIIVKLNKDLQVIGSSEKVSYHSMEQDAEYLYSIGDGYVYKVSKETLATTKLTRALYPHISAAQFFTMDDEYIYCRASENGTQDAQAVQKIFKINKNTLTVAASTQVGANSFDTISANDDNFLYGIRYKNEAITKWDKRNLALLMANANIRSNSSCNIILLDDIVVVASAKGSKTLAALNKNNLEPVYNSVDSISESAVYLCKNRSFIFMADVGSGLIMRFPISPEIKYQISHYEEVDS